MGPSSVNLGDDDFETVPSAQILIIVYGAIITLAQKPVLSSIHHAYLYLTLPYTHVSAGHVSHRVFCTFTEIITTSKTKSHNYVHV